MEKANGGCGGTPLATLAEEIRSGYVIRETHIHILEQRQRHADCDG